MPTYIVRNASNLPVLTTTSWPAASRRLHDLRNSAGCSLDVDGAEVSRGFVESLRHVTARLGGGYREATAEDIATARSM